MKKATYSMVPTITNAGKGNYRDREKICSWQGRGELRGQTGAARRNFRDEMILYHTVVLDR